MTAKRAERAACVLASGGLDSSVLIADLLARGRRVHPLYVRCGLLWEGAELARLARVLKALRSPRLEPLAVSQASMRGLVRGHWSLDGRGAPMAGSPDESVYLPGRNLLLLSQAALLCHARGLRSIAIGLLKGNPFSDASPAFLRRMEGVIALAFGARVEISAPYAALTKAEVLARVPGFPAHLTLSCLRPRGSRPCGACSKCEERGRVACA